MRVRAGVKTEETLRYLCILLVASLTDPVAQTSNVFVANEMQTSDFAGNRGTVYQQRGDDDI